MSSINFTKNNLTNLEIKPRRYRVRDTKIIGLNIEVMPSGRKSFQVYKRLKGQATPIKVTLGQFDQMTIEQARKAAQIALAQMADGINPNQAQKVYRLANQRVEEVFEEYIGLKTLKASTLRGYEQVLNCYLSDWKKYPLKSISETHVKERHQMISEKSEAQADLCMRMLRAVFNFAKNHYKDDEENSLFPRNPVGILSHLGLWNKVERKQSRLTESDLKKLNSAMQAIRSKEHPASTLYAVCDFVEMCLFTGLRKQELLQLQWYQINFDDQTIIIDKTKNASNLEIPMLPHIETILRRRKAHSQNSFVFHADNQYGYIRCPKKSLVKISRLAGISFSLHDLRRTFSSIATTMNITSYMLKRLLNHKTSRNDVTAGYIVLTAEELRKPASKVQDKLLSLMGQPLYGEDIGTRLTNLLGPMNDTQKQQVVNLLLENAHRLAL